MVVFRSILVLSYQCKDPGCGCNCGGDNRCGVCHCSRECGRGRHCDHHCDRGGDHCDRDAVVTVIVVVTGHDRGGGGRDHGVSVGGTGVFGGSNRGRNCDRSGGSCGGRSRVHDRGRGCDTDHNRNIILVRLHLVRLQMKIQLTHPAQNARVRRSNIPVTKKMGCVS